MSALDFASVFWRVPSTFMAVSRSTRNETGSHGLKFFTRACIPFLLITLPRLQRNQTGIYRAIKINLFNNYYRQLNQIIKNIPICLIRFCSLCLFKVLSICLQYSTTLKSTQDSSPVSHHLICFIILRESCRITIQTNKHSFKLYTKNTMNNHE